MFIGRIVRLVVVAWVVSMIAGSIAALSVKRRVVPTTDESADEIVAASIFGPLAFHSTAQQFRGGDLECWYGGGVLDLREATLAPDGATLRVRAVFGGGQILVPAAWKVVNKVRGMGGLSDTRPAMGRPADAPELVIEGMAFAGGFAVSSEVEPGEAEWLQKMDVKRHEKAEAKTEPAPATEPETAPAT